MTSNTQKENQHSLDGQTKSPRDFSPYSLRNHFLISMPNLEDSYFSQTVTYICDHTENGALGIILNNPLDVKVSEIFKQLNISDNKNIAIENESLTKSVQNIGEQAVLAGGPVNVDRGFILHSAGQEWESTLKISSTISLTASKDILVALAENRGPEKALVALGYAGWDPGQLEEEITANSWLTVPADDRIIFDMPFERRWASASNYLGIDINSIHTMAGHA